MAGLLDRMENSGLITRGADGHDRRANRIRLTDHGAELEATLTGVQMNEDGPAWMDFDLPDADSERIRVFEGPINEAIT